MPSSSPDLESNPAVVGSSQLKVPTLNMQFVHVPERPSTTSQRRSRIILSSAGGGERHSRPPLTSRPTSGRTTASPLTAEFPVLTLRNFAKSSAAAAGRVSESPSHPSFVSSHPRAHQHHQQQPPLLTERNAAGESPGSVPLPASLSARRDEPHPPQGTPPRPLDSVSWTAETDSASGAGFLASAARNTKPPLLRTLERYLQTEMALVDPEDDAQALRVHRDALRIFAENFPTYTGLLSNIMAAYDRALQGYSRCAASVGRLHDETERANKEHNERIEALVREFEERTRATDAKLNEYEALAANNTDSSVAVVKEREAMAAEVAAMRAERSMDLNKMLLLVKAVKESDLRIRTLTHKLQQAQVQLEEKEKLKKMLAESQEEIGKMKDAYRSSVPMAMHSEMVKDLTEKLEASRQETRRARRMFATRGSQLYSITQVVEQLRAEKRQQHQKARRRMTPRPDWDAAAASLPELAEATRPVHNEDLTVSEAEDEAAARVVDASDSTADRVAFLVARVAELTAANEALRAAAAAAQDAADRATSAQLRAAHAAASDTLHTPSVELACGKQEWVPLHLRKSGTVTVKPLPTVELHRLILRFARFLRDKAEGKEPVPDVPKWLALFCRMEVSETGAFPGDDPSTAAYSIVRGAERVAPVSAVASLFLQIVAGAMPPRLLGDALTVMDNVAAEIEHLAESQRRRRLRKGAITEVVGPLLSFKTRAELDELKAALGVETTVDAARLAADDSPFMQALLQQSCVDGPALYTSLVHALCAAEGASAATATVAAHASHADGSAAGLTKRAVVECLLRAEPLLPHTLIANVVAGPNGQGLEDHEKLSLLHVLERVARLPIIRLTPRGTVPTEAVSHESGALGPVSHEETE